MNCNHGLLVSDYLLNSKDPETCITAYPRIGLQTCLSLFNT